MRESLCNRPDEVILSYENTVVKRYAFSLDKSWKDAIVTELHENTSTSKHTYDHSVMRAQIEPTNVALVSISTMLVKW
jgi:hypothetical protein